MTESLHDFAMPLPWQSGIWQQLSRARQSGRLPHALLLHGAQGLGKAMFARWLAQSLLCSSPNTELAPCGTCASCKLVQAGTHPDFLFVTPEEDKQQISVDQVRAACDRLAMTSSRSGYRIAIIDPAQQMTVAAANSLLKTLEEPGERSLLILLSNQASTVLPTIRSRCQQWAIATPAPDQARAWLATQTDKAVADDLLRQAGGAPLKVLGYLQGGYETLRQEMQGGVAELEQGTADMAQLAQAWSDERLPDRLVWLDGWLCQRIQAEIVRNADPVTRDPRQGGGQMLNINHLFQALDKLRELKGQLRRTALQRELALENLFMWLNRALTTRA